MNGANTNMLFIETDKVEHQLLFYAATKKSTENMAHSHSHLFKLPIIMFLFFTIYGSWGRPDMAYFKFTQKILKGIAIDVYNDGNIERDFIYTKDLCHAIFLLICAVPNIFSEKHSQHVSFSPAGLYKVVNIGNSHPV